VQIPPVLDLSRYAYQHELDGPRMRFGIVWFALLFVAFASNISLLVLTLVVVASVGSLQVAGTWRSRKAPVQQLIASAGTGLVIASAYFGNRTAGVALVLLALLAVVFGAAVAPNALVLTPEALQGNLPAASATLRSSVPLALAGVSAIQVYRIDSMAFLFLLSVVCVFDAGDYLCGSGYQSRIIGPLAGSVGVLTVTASMSAINPPPLVEDSHVWIVGILMAVLCPLGTLLGSWMLPVATAKAPGLRRLDSWLLAAPALWIALVLIGYP
jgi:hypothetical protein